MLASPPLPWPFPPTPVLAAPLPHPAASAWLRHPPPAPSTVRAAIPLRGPCARPFPCRVAPAPPSPATTRSSAWQCTPSSLWANHPSAASHLPLAMAGSSPHADLPPPAPRRNQRDLPRLIKQRFAL